MTEFSECNSISLKSYASFPDFFSRASMKIIELGSHRKWAWFFNCNTQQIFYYNAPGISCVVFFFITSLSLHPNLTSGILTPPIYFDILVYHTEICWCTMLYDVRRHHCIYSYMSKYEMISLHILVYTSISYMTAYRGTCLFMTVYTFETKYIPSYTMLTRWHEMLMHLYNLTYVYIRWPNDSFPAAPPRLARLKAANLLRLLFWFKALKFKHHGV